MGPIGRTLPHSGPTDVPESTPSSPPLPPERSATHDRRTAVRDTAVRLRLGSLETA